MKNCKNRQGIIGRAEENPPFSGGGNNDWLAARSISASLQSTRGAYYNCCQRFKRAGLDTCYPAILGALRPLAQAFHLVL